MIEQEKIKVLLAEDDRNLGNILKSYLEAKGYTTQLCINGQDAMDHYNREKFDFCIVDVMMPVKDVLHWHVKSGKPISESQSFSYRQIA